MRDPNSLNICYLAFELKRNCNNCNDTLQYYGPASNSTISYPSGSWYIITKHQLKHAGSLNTTVTPPTSPKAFWTSISYAGHTFKHLWKGNSEGLPGCTYFIPTGDDSDDD